MEVCVESVEGAAALPPACYVGVRIGEVLKQGRYDPSRCYHFPQVDRRRNAKVDIYQHVGSCLVAVDPETRSSHEVKVQCTDPAHGGMQLLVKCQSKATDVAKEQRETRSKVLKTQAKDYLTKHRIEARLSEAVKALLKHEPADPTEFLVKHLRESAAGEAPAPPEVAAEPKPHVLSEELQKTESAAPPSDVGALTAEASGRLEKEPQMAEAAAPNDIGVLRDKASPAEADGGGRSEKVLTDALPADRPQAAQDSEIGAGAPEGVPAVPPANFCGAAALPAALAKLDMPPLVRLTTVGMLGGQALSLGLGNMQIFI